MALILLNRTSTVVKLGYGLDLDRLVALNRLPLSDQNEMQTEVDSELVTEPHAVQLHLEFS